MSSSPLFSVIIPVFNTEDYIERCLDSIICQSYSNFELIIIDDGSTDRCGKICDEYSENDGRIQVIHKKNEGLGSARIAGIREAKGEYISFVDSDDWVDLSMLQEACDAIKRYPFVDIIIGGYLIEKDNKTINPFKKMDKILMNAVNAKQNMFSGEIFDWSLCDKLYRKSLFTESLLNTWPCGYGEDTYANWRLFGGAKIVLYLPFYAYHYFMHRESMTHQVFSEKKFEYLRIYDSIVRQINPVDMIMLGNVLYTALNVCLPLLYYSEKNYAQYSDEITKGIIQMHNYFDVLKGIKSPSELIYIERMFQLVDQDKSAIAKRFEQQKKKLLEFASGDEVYIYGAGDIAEELFRDIEMLEIGIKGVIVSKIDQEGQDSFCGKRLVVWDDLRRKEHDLKIITAMNYKHTLEVLNKIEEENDIKIFNGGQYSIYYYQ